MRDPAPPYRGEGEHALWHVSGDPAIALFRPHRAATAIADEPLVWATTDRDVERFVGGRLARVHAVEPPWDERMRRTPLYAYLPVWLVHTGAWP